MTTRHAPPRRGYALLFVMLLMIALGVVVSGLLSALAQTVASSKAAHEDLQQMYGCDGAVRLALAEARRHSGDVDNTRLQASLGLLSAALASDVNPRTGRPYADLSSIRAESATRAVLTSATLPFMGMQYVEEGNRITVAANTAGGRGRACQADAPNRRRTMSYFQFALASTDVLGNPTGTQSIAGTAGDVFVLTHGMPGVPRRQTTPVGGTTVQHVNLSGGDVYRPTPPSGQPWRFVNKKKRLGGLLGKKRKKKARRPTLEAFLKYPTDIGGVPDPAMSRYVKGADLYIIDGDWFVPDASGAFPGRRIWSDQPIPARASDDPLAFTLYETDDTNASRGGAAVVRYGLVRLNAAPGDTPMTATPMVRGFCGAGREEELAPVMPDGVDCGDGPDVNIVPPAEGEQDPYRRAAFEGFADPNGPGSDGTPILPIWVDVAALRAALTTPAPGDLGDARCLGPNPLVCPVDKRFKGSVWIGTLAGGMAAGERLPDGSLPPPCPLAVHPPPSVSPPATACARPNAVVLYNAEDLTPFTGTGEVGLSIASNLPMYVVGGVNTRPHPPPAGGIDARVALLAPQITALSRSFDFVARAWDDPQPIPNRNVTLTWNTSLFTGWATDAFTERDPAQHVVRQLERDIDIDLVGSVVAMFQRGQYLQKTNFNKGKGSYDAVADPAVTGLPVFAGETDTFTGGRVRFPGADTRDLRKTEIIEQPPNAPRLSVDLQPLDKR